MQLTKLILPIHRYPILSLKLLELENVRFEFRSFSKNAGFTGTRCALTVVPKTLTAKAADGSTSNCGNCGIVVNPPNLMVFPI